MCTFVECDSAVNAHLANALSPPLCLKCVLDYCIELVLILLFYQDSLLLPIRVIGIHVFILWRVMNDAYLVPNKL